MTTGFLRDAGFPSCSFRLDFRLLREGFPAGVFALELLMLLLMESSGAVAPGTGDPGETALSGMDPSEAKTRLFIDKDARESGLEPGRLATGEGAGV